MALGAGGLGFRSLGLRGVREPLHFWGYGITCVKKIFLGVLIKKKDLSFVLG